MSKFPRTITEIQEGLKAGEFTAVELTEDIFAGIATTDEKLNAFITLNKEEALEQARSARMQGRIIKIFPYWVAPYIKIRVIKTILNFSEILNHTILIIRKVACY